MQKEIKMVLFSPTENHYAVDIYVLEPDGKRWQREHCGRGWVSTQAAWMEAVEWLRSNESKLTLK
jgi:hypothetical protein